MNSFGNIVFKVCIHQQTVIIFSFVVMPTHFFSISERYESGLIEQLALHDILEYYFTYWVMS